MMKEETKRSPLIRFSDRLALIVTDLNGLQSSLVNEEVTEADFGEDLSDLFDRLRAVEQAVSDLGDMFWR